ncbi:RNA 2',3'-cyclic phosphodiesterase [Aquabacterium sp.]|uniref:RNA 2',3'-cyclic phosphodiesterase n=1 Tax=Aquabacterium sp. TaxID=1872578 RepID=UPI002E2F4F3F|nr:RNA 2',3'-cyclic phosphodiesterase [Aquabacterium sp.]HEX5312844.1 RNA 2',3'-cyclic phosphodiesterase [Aquabacterium sp.]
MTAPAPDHHALRLFLALWPDATTRHRVQHVQAQQNWPQGARPTPAPDLHLTLHFLGQVPEHRLADLLQALPLPTKSIELALDTLELWPNHIAALTPSSVPEALLALHAKLAETIDSLGLPRETRPYRPHVTLARKAQGWQPVPGVPLIWQACGYVLVLSDRGYHVLQHLG